MNPHTPPDDGIYLDHIAHWVPDLEAAGRVLEGLGFRLTPPTEHTHSPAPGARVEPAGSANRCVMLGKGYLEVLAPTADTAIGRELGDGIRRYVGVHLAAFCVADAAAERDRLAGEGFAQRPTVALERVCTDVQGRADTLRFTVVRPEPGCLAEGRVQFLSHHTPGLLWRPDLLRHPNGVEALTDLLFCVADPDEASGRYRRYLRTPADPVPGGHVLRFARGALTILDPEHTRQALGVEPPALPWMAGYGLRCASLPRTGAYLETHRVATARRNQALVVVLPGSVGGVLAFHDGAAPWRLGTGAGA